MLPKLYLGVKLHINHIISNDKVIVKDGKAKSDPTEFLKWEEESKKKVVKQTPNLRNEDEYL